MICVEITESGPMRNLTLAVAVRVTTLKIDRSFVQDMTATVRGRAIAEGAVKLAHVLGLSVVAEGVETTQQAKLLRDIGTDVGQGYLFARPLTAAQMPAFLMEFGRRQGAPTFS